MRPQNVYSATLSLPGAALAARWGKRASVFRVAKGALSYSAPAFLVSLFLVSLFDSRTSDPGGMMISLAGKAALITGGSRGIGAAAVKLFAQAGADVVFSYNKAKAAAQQMEQEAGKHGTRVEAFKADVGRHADNKKLVDQTVARLGRIDILVANAGVWNIDDHPIEKMTEKQWDEMIRINLKSVYSVIHFAAAHMIKQKTGKIIPISSTAGQRGESFHTHYGATKGAVIAFTKGLATELAPHGILVNSVAPGGGATAMWNPV